MRVCPRCQYLDPFCWRSPYSKGMEFEYARLEDLQIDQPEIAIKLFNAPVNHLGKKNPIREVVIKPYVYGLWESGYVRRRWFEIWRYHGWKAIPMEKHKPKDNVDLDKFLCMDYNI